MTIKKVGILGGGKMATEIFKLLSGFDYDLVMWSPFQEEIEKAENELTRKLKRRAAKGGPRGEAAAARLARMTFGTDMALLGDVDLAIEAVIESLEPKRKVFRDLDRIARPDTIFATNTSSLSPSSMVPSAERRRRFAGLHYFYPVSIMSFVEIIPTSGTDPEVTEALTEFVSATGKRPLVVRREVNGYLVNRVLGAYYNEGGNLVGEGYWLPRQVDEAGKRFATLGPCESVDHVGLDVILSGVDSADASWGRKDHIAVQNRGHEPWTSMHFKLREDGRIGRKVGVGFYRYEDNQPVDDPEYFAKATPTLPVYHRTPAYDERIVEKRLFYAILLEAVLTYERGIGSKEDIDYTMKELLGLSHGPFEYIEKVGIDEVRADCDELVEKVGSRYRLIGFLRRPEDPITEWEADPWFRQISPAG